MRASKLTAAVCLTEALLSVAEGEDVGNGGGAAWVGDATTRLDLSAVSPDAVEGGGRVDVAVTGQAGNLVNAAISGAEIAGGAIAGGSAVAAAECAGAGLLVIGVEWICADDAVPVADDAVPVSAIELEDAGAGGAIAAWSAPIGAETAGATGLRNSSSDSRAHSRVLLYSSTSKFCLTTAKSGTDCELPKRALSVDEAVRAR